MTRGVKQFLYGSGFLVFFALLTFGIYALFLKPAPTCFDKKQNQDEEGIDCGGPCTKDCAIDTLLPIRRADVVRAFRIDDRRSTLLLTIQNPNVTHGARSFSYEVNLYDDAQRILYALRGNTFLYAGETRYLFFSDVPVGAAEVTGIDFASKNTSWDRAEKFRKPNLLLHNFATRREEEGIRVQGAFSNQDTVPLFDIEVVALFFGRAGELLGASATLVDEVQVGAQKTFSVFHPPLLNLDEAGTKVFLSAPRP